MTEARIVDSEDGGREPEGDGWFVLNAKDARWLDGGLGKYTGFEGTDAAHFPQLGININVLQPGEPMTMYHARTRAQKHRAGVAVETTDAKGAYTNFEFRRTGYKEGWLPE